MTEDPDRILDDCWTRLEGAVNERESVMRTPVVSTLGSDGSPHARMVVLRSVDRGEWRLGFHTDRRSPKVAELRHDPRLSWVFWDPVDRIQIRIESTATIHLDDPVADAQWDRLPDANRLTYAGARAPSSEIDKPDSGTQPLHDGTLAREGRRSFASVFAIAVRLEWLWLGQGGHRRILFESQGGSIPPARPRHRWLVP